MSQFCYHNIFLLSFRIAELSLEIWRISFTPLTKRFMSSKQDSQSAVTLTSSYWWPDADYANIRNLIERIVDCPSGRQYPGIWILYILLEISRCDKNSNVKRIYYRAIRSCCWSKDLWWMIKHPSVKCLFSDKEVADILALKTEKGFYMRAQSIL